MRPSSGSQAVTTADYPVCLRLSGKAVLVVGGGAIASGRVSGLVEVGARVHVVAPVVDQAIAQAAARGAVTWTARAFVPTDVDGAALVVSAVDDPAVTQAVVTAARARGTWVTAADQPELCDFTMPSVGRRGPITVAVSTGGRAPALAGVLRRRFERLIEPEDLAIAAGVAVLRRVLAPGPARMKLLTRLVKGATALADRVRRRAA